MWHEALAGLGPVTTIVAPVAGPSAPDGDELVVRPTGVASPDLPRLAHGLTVELGREVGGQLGGDDVDLVVAVRAYTALLGIGVRDATGAQLVVDLDDDDAAYFRSIGDRDEADRFERLVGSVQHQAALVVSTQGFGGTAAVPNSVRVPATVPAAEPAVRRVVLVGNMGYEPNAAGARWFLDSVLPLVREHVPDVDLVIAGPGSESFVPFGRGYVAELGTLLAGAGVAIVPILHGSGTRIKILDAWAHGLPVVSTTVGADGLGAVHGAHLLLADDPGSFAAAIVRTLGDPALGAALGAAGRELVQEHYSREHVVADVRALLRSTVGAQRAQPGSGCNTAGEPIPPPC